MEKKWRAFGVYCGFYEGKKQGLKLFFGDFRTYFGIAQWPQLLIKLQDEGLIITSDYSLLLIVHQKSTGQA